MTHLFCAPARTIEVTGSPQFYKTPWTQAALADYAERVQADEAPLSECEIRALPEWQKHLELFRKGIA